MINVMEVTDMMSVLSPHWAPEGHGASDKPLTANR
jgi:hypothetical protein